MKYFSPAKRRKTILIIFPLLVVPAMLIFLAKDKIAYVGRVTIVDVDCSQKGQILEDVFERDQKIRQPNYPFREFAKEDHKNQELVISILEKCGMLQLPEVTSKQLNAVWFVLQHGEAKFRKKYFPWIEDAMKRGDLAKEKYALMLDRMMMDEGKPQIYGSQISNRKLYKLSDPKTVNQRRAEMGMETIESYLARFNIEFSEDLDE